MPSQLETLADFKGDVMQSGLHPALPNDEKPFWDTGSGVQFQERSVQPFPGQFSFILKIENLPIIGALERSIDGKKCFFYGSPQSLFRFVQTVGGAQNVTRASGLYNGITIATQSQISTRWSMTPWGRWIVATNGVDAVQIYKTPNPVDGGGSGSTKFIDLQEGGSSTLLFSKAELVASLGPYVLAFNLTEGGQKLGDTFRWCHTDNVENWVPAATNAAGQLPIRELNGDIVSVVPLGRGLGLYGGDSLFLVSFIGPPFYFGAQKLLDGIGAVSKHSVVNVGRLHYGLSQYGFFRTEGFNVQFIDRPSMHEYIFTHIEHTQLSQCAAYHDPANNHVVWNFPPDNLAVAYNYITGSWLFPGIVRTAGSDGEVFGFPIVGDADGNLFSSAVGQVGTPPISAPLELSAEYSVETPFGQGGFGQGAFGGTESGIA